MQGSTTGAHQDAERKRWADAWQDHGLVFTLEDGSPINPDSWSGTFECYARDVADGPGTNDPDDIS